MSDCAIILAGGSGSRMRGVVRDKVLEELLGLPVILHSFKAFADSKKVDTVVFVCRDDAQQAEISKSLVKFLPNESAKIEVIYARGGAERRDSVLNGLRVLADRNGIVFIHDGARPLVGAENIIRLSDTAKCDGSAVLASKVVDTIKRIPSQKENLSARLLEDLDRSTLWAMQTPQVFKINAIHQAYEKIVAEEIFITDDVAAANYAGIGVSIVENLTPNPKITVPSDIAYIEFLTSHKK